MSAAVQTPADAGDSRPVDAADEAERIAIDLAYNASKPGAFQRAADEGTRHEIMLRIMLREVS